MAYDAYKTVPKDLIPTTADEYALFHIAIDVKICIRIRHDFHTAARIAGKIDRGLPKPIPPWESEFAKSATPRTLAELAAEHDRLKLDAFSYAQTVKGNLKLAKLLHENLFSLFPPIGFLASTGDVQQRLIKNEKQTVLSIFHPLGVEDNARLINLLLKKPSNFYW